MEFDVKLADEDSTRLGRFLPLPNTDTHRLKFELNTNQKRFYEENKLNFHMNKIYLNRENEVH